MSRAALFHDIEINVFCIYLKLITKTYESKQTRFIKNLILLFSKDALKWSYDSKYILNVTITFI